MLFFDVFQTTIEGISLIVVPMSPAFRGKNKWEQVQLAIDLQKRAKNAGLTGTVIPVWEGADGKMRSVAPKYWAHMFDDMDFQYVLDRVNGRIPLE